MVISRSITEKAKEILTKYPMLVISGPRQSGKTTLTRQLRPDFIYLNLELDENRTFAMEDPHQFLQKYQGGVILDEVQNVPSLFPYMKHYTDLRGKAGEYILTGSQHFLLLEKTTQSLAGRVGLLQLLPFSNAELNAAGLMPKGPEIAIFKGGYPRIFDKNIHTHDFYPAYISTYVERDVRQISAIKDLRLFRQFLTALAGRVGQIVNFSELGNILGIDSKTVKSWVGILEASFIIFLLSPYHRNFDKRIIKSPKVYFYDTGLACSLLNIREVGQLDAHFAKGALFENMIILELTKHFLNKGELPPFYFWQDSNQREVDLLIDFGASLKAIEIKAGKTINQGFFKNLQLFKTLAQGFNPDCYVIYGGDTAQPRTNVGALPWNQVEEVLKG
ncbi:MAG: ATP-binding protein [Saprospiraceae bacterium]|nr:ATP-binding protein [Saprospiraceae bacterium]